MRTATRAVLPMLGLALVACTPADRPLAFDSIDLITRGEWRAAVTFCGDETFLGVPLEAGGERAISFRSLTTAPGGTPTLELAGCLALPAGQSPEGELEVVLVSAAGEPRRLRVSLSEHLSETGFWRTRLELGRGAAPVSLRVRAALPAGTLWLREVRLWAETPLAAARGSTTRANEPPMRILFISVDTLREDALGALDGSRAGAASATPELDRFAGDAQVFQPHYAAAGWTRPSHGTLLTGWPPGACGAFGTEQPLYAGIRTLAERFREAGFRTSALFFELGWFHPRFDFDRGFEEYRLEPWRLDRAVPEVTRWISAHRDEPFFFFFHTFEPHSDARWLPYESPGATRQTVAETLGDPGGELAGYGCRGGFCASSLLQALDQGKVESLPREDEALALLYRRSASFVDRELGKLFEGLRRLGVYDDLLIVLTSDHGEMLLEHGKLLHGKPWEEVLRVPLMIKWPDGRAAGERMTVPTAAEDLAPTLLEAAGLDAGDLPGRSLRDRRRARPIFSGHNFRAVVHDGLKAVFRDPEPALLFDLTADPGERHNLAMERPEDLERLRRLVDRKWDRDLELGRRFARPGGAQPPGLTEEERRRLQALGYLGSF